MNIVEKHTKQLLTPASGFLEGYTFSLNPYSGCAFACSYCYVRKSPVGLFRKEDWGTWVDIKANAADRYQAEIKKARKKYPSISIFMSSSTDPYQPVEYKNEITKSILEAMVKEPPDFLFLQTRSPLVTRDIELLKQLNVLVSMTVETDREDIRKLFSPSAPPISARLKAIDQIGKSGIKTQVAIAPLLPSTNSFSELLSKVVNRITVDDYFQGDGSEGKRTKTMGIYKIYEKMNLQEWYNREKYKQLVVALQRYFPNEAIFISKEGFLPPVN
ncbi:radical SAM protein [Bacillus salitolerans]|uniref:Radical SAM protein n=1 Tax=Bacillus salitolerans TaxID=1437434 RepID=A0ABW4LNH4_9BACI